jgi:hypothetical protein
MNHWWLLINLITSDYQESELLVIINQLNHWRLSIKKKIHL